MREREREREKKKEEREENVRNCEETNFFLFIEKAH